MNISLIHYKSREISIQGERDGTACAVNNQLWALLFTNSKKYFSIHQQPILQLVDDYTSGIVTFLLYIDFPDKSLSIKALLRINLYFFNMAGPELFSCIEANSISNKKISPIAGDKGGNNKFYFMQSCALIEKAEHFCCVILGK